MALLSYEYAFSSLMAHLGLFFLVFGFLQLVFYIVIPDYVRPLKLSTGKYPPKDLQWKELYRSTRSVIIAFLMDLLVLRCYDINIPLVRRGIQLSQTQQELLKDDPTGLTFMQQMPTLDDYKSEAVFWTVVMVFWADFHFYWTHRLLHENEWLYKNVHKIHHESYNPDTISGLSFHPIESLIYFSSMFSFLITPVPLWVYHFMRFALIISPANGHTSHIIKGFEFKSGEPRPWYYISDPVDHWIHHTKFNYNFGSGIFPRNGIWDNICGTAYRPALKKQSSGLSAREKSAKAQQGLIHNKD